MAKWRNGITVIAQQLHLFAAEKPIAIFFLKFQDGESIEPALIALTGKENNVISDFQIQSKRVYGLLGTVPHF